MDKFNIFLNQICNCYDSMLILCDFNLPKIPRDSPCNSSGVSEERFVDLLKDHFLTQTYKLPMRENNVLDLIISSNPQSVTTTEVLSAQNALIFTDHNILSFDLMATVKHQRISTSKADWLVYVMLWMQLTSRLRAMLAQTSCLGLLNEVRVINKVPL